MKVLRKYDNSKSKEHEAGSGISTPMGKRERGDRYRKSVE